MTRRPGRLILALDPHDEAELSRYDRPENEEAPHQER